MRDDERTRRVKNGETSRRRERINAKENERARELAKASTFRARAAAVADSSLRANSPREHRLPKVYPLSGQLLQSGRRC